MTLQFSWILQDQGFTNTDDQRCVLEITRSFPNLFSFLKVDQTITGLSGSHESPVAQNTQC